MNNHQYSLWSKTIALHKRLLAINKMLNQPQKISITLWGIESITEPKIITKKEIIKRLRLRRRNLKHKLQTNKNKLGDKLFNKALTLAEDELRRGF